MVVVVVVVVVGTPAIGGWEKGQKSIQRVRGSAGGLHRKLERRWIRNQNQKLVLAAQLHGLEHFLGLIFDDDAGR